MANCIRCGRQLPAFSFKKVCQWCVQHEAAQRGEVLEDERQRVMPAPWIRRESTITLTKIFFGANVAVFLAMALAGGSAMDFNGRVMVHFGANFGPYTLSGDWWRLLTYMFLHAGVMHIVFNMWCLWDLGALCESLYGRWTFAAIYLITGIAAGLASVAWNPGVLSVGASGAIFGLAGALFASFYLGEFSIPKSALQCTFRSLAFFIGFNVLFGIGYNVFLGQNFGGIDNAAHVGGLVSGLVLGALIARIAPQHDAPLRRLSVVGVVALAVLAGGLGVRHWRSGPMRLARAFEALGENRTDSVARLKLIVQQEPNSAPMHAMLGQAYFERQQFAEAETEFKRALELQPKNASARFDLGITYLNEKRPEDAKAVFTEMLSQATNTGEAHYGLGLAAVDQGKYDAAITEFKAAEADGGDVSGLYFDMGKAYAGLKQYDDAIASYLKDKEKSGDYPELENALADAYQAKGMMQQAQEARSKAAQLSSGQPGR
jgi:membrane associated rhomboid family serine protease/Flp pilus assembly protein TadD